MIQRRHHHFVSGLDKRMNSEQNCETKTSHLHEDRNRNSNWLLYCLYLSWVNKKYVYECFAWICFFCTHFRICRRNRNSANLKRKLDRTNDICSNVGWIERGSNFQGQVREPRLVKYVFYLLFESVFCNTRIKYVHPIVLCDLFCT